MTESNVNHLHAGQVSNYLQPNRFKIIIDRKNYPSLEYFAQSVSHPSVSASPSVLGRPRLTGLPFAPDKLTFGELTVSIFCDENLAAYLEMFKWMESTVVKRESPAWSSERTPRTVTSSAGVEIETDPNAGVPPPDPPTRSDITVALLTASNQPNVYIKYLDCVPTDLGNIELVAAEGGGAVTFTTTFNYACFNIESKIIT